MDKKDFEETLQKACKLLQRIKTRRDERTVELVDREQPQIEKRSTGLLQRTLPSSELKKRMDEEIIEGDAMFCGICGRWVAYGAKCPVCGSLKH